MKGTRPLDNSEIRLVSDCFTGTYEVRNRGLFMLGNYKTNVNSIFYESRYGGLEMKILLFFKPLVFSLILGCLFGCGEDNDDSIAGGSPTIPTITIEKLQIEELDGELVGDRREIYTALDEIFIDVDPDEKLFGEKVLWRLNANPAPTTDLAVIIASGDSEHDSEHYVIIPKDKNSSAEFSTFDVKAVRYRAVLNLQDVNLDSPDATFHIKINPLPTVSVVGKGVVADLDKLQSDYPKESLGDHRIPEDYGFPLYKVGEPSKIFFKVLVRTAMLSSIVSVAPPPGSIIRANSLIHITYNKPPREVVSNGIPTVSGKTVTIRGPFRPGPLTLFVTWGGGSISLRYTVIR